MNFRWAVRDRAAWWGMNSVLVYPQLTATLTSLLVPPSRQCQTQHNMICHCTYVDCERAQIEPWRQPPKPPKMQLLTKDASNMHSQNKQFDKSKKTNFPTLFGSVNGAMFVAYTCAVARPSISIWAKMYWYRNAAWGRPSLMRRPLILAPFKWCKASDAASAQSYSMNAKP